MLAWIRRWNNKRGGKAGAADGLFAQLLAQTGQGFWFIDPAGVTIEVNPALCRLLDRPREQIVGRAARDFVPADQLPILDEQLTRRRAGMPGDYELALLRPDGSRVHCHNHATPLLDSAGRPLGSVGLWTDISARVAAEDGLRLYMLAINSITDPVSVIDSRRRYVLVNDAWCRSTGRRREDVIDQDPELIFGEALSEERRSALQACIETQRPIRIRTPAARASDGTPVVLETSYYPYGGDASGVQRVVLVSRDVSAEVESARTLAGLTADLRATLEATGDGIFASDSTHPQEPLRFINRRLRRMFGLPADDAVPLSAADLFAAARPLFIDPARELARIDDIVANNRADESRLLLRDGRVLLRRCEPSQGARGTVRVWSFRDITAEERALHSLRAAEATQRALLDAFPGYIAAVDPEDRYVYVNRRLSEALGGAPEQLVGRHFTEVAPPANHAAGRLELARARAGEVVRSERSFPPRPGQPGLDLDLTTVAGPPREDGTQIVYAFGIDSTARKAAESRVLAARDEAERASRAKSQFVAQMSHELRTPLNAVLGFAQLLQSDRRLALDNGAGDHLREIVTGGRHLLNLINQILDLGRIESGQLVMQRGAVALAPLLEECLSLIAPLAAARGLRVLPAPALPAGAAVMADRTRLQQVLINLLGNAVKYNREGGELALETALDNGLWQLTVRDNGPGLDAAQCARLFQPFERLDAAARGIEGTGIGLALSRRLIDAMGGQIAVDSTPGIGSRFWLRLPAADLNAADALPAAADTTAAPLDSTLRHQVLHIDDNPVNIVLMEAMLARLEGLRVTSIDNPEQGLRHAQADPPDLVLLDIQMPGMDGFEVLRHMRADARLRHIPAIAVSADGLQASIDAALAAGFEAYLTKPLDLDRLLRTVRRALRGVEAGGS